MAEAGPAAFLRRNEGWLWAGALAAAVLVVGVGLVVAPEVFWDRFLWEDIWGPTLADARGVDALCWSDGQVVEAVGRRCPEGATMAHSGYTLTAELTYGLVLAALLYGIYRHILLRHRVDTGGGFLVGLLPLIFLGPFARVMEDAEVFDPRPGEPGLFAPFFISPWIYFQIAVYALAFLGVAIAMDRAGLDDRKRRLALAAALAVETAAYAAAVSVWGDELRVVVPWWQFALGAAAAFALYVLVVERLRGAPRFHGTVFALGLPLLVPSLVLTARWGAGERWSCDLVRCGGEPLAGVLVVVLVLGTLFAVWWVARMVGIHRPAALAMATPVSLALALAHLVDGFSTWMALKDPFGLGLRRYTEKHPVSDWILEVPGTNGFLFPVVKLAMVVLVVRLIDKEFEDKGEADRNLAGLVKMAVFVLGFGPGIRNLLLMAFTF